MTIFAVGRTYTRQEIRAVLGGDVSSELPHQGGSVVCGCFTPGSSPDAPDVILCGREPEMERWTKVFAAQRYFIPCFVQASITGWEYMGRFVVRRVITDKAQLKARAKAASRRVNDVSTVLYLLGESKRAP